MSYWSQSIATILGTALCVLSSSSANTQANSIGQARGHVQKIVGRIALGQVIGTYVDLPYTLRACEDESQRRDAYEILQDVIKGHWPDGAKRALLCRPFVGAFERLGNVDGRMAFQLPQDRCPDIQKTVSMALDDARGNVYRGLFDDRAQLRVINVFDRSAWGRTVKIFDIRWPVDNVRRQFPSTGFPTRRHYDFIVEECRADAGTAKMTILMRRL